MSEDVKHTLFPQLGYGAGTFLSFGLVDAFAHLGPTGLVVGGLAALIAARHGPQVKDQLHESFPLDQVINRPHKSGRSVLDRALGRFPAEEAEDDTVLVNEPDPEPELVEAPLPIGAGVAIIGDDPRYHLHLADNFQPDANAPLATGVFFVGIPGSGKTGTLALFLEQYITRFGLPCVLFDVVGDLKSIVEDGLCGETGFVVTPDSMPTMANVIEQRLQIIVDLQQCRRPGEAFINYEVAGQLIARTTRELLNTQSAIAPEDRVPCLVGLDEIHIWTPQNPPSYLSQMTAKDLLETLTIVATTGRKYGVVPFLACPRISKVHKDVIAGCELRILGKVGLDNDLKRYREYVSPAVISDEDLQALPKGRMVVCMDGRQLVAQFYRRKSRHISHTPSILAGPLPARPVSANRAPVERPHPEPVAVAVQAEAAQEPPARNWEPPIRMTRADIQKHPALRAALAHYQEGHTSHRELARAMNVSHATAGKYINMLRMMGEIS